MYVLKFTSSHTVQEQMILLVYGARTVLTGQTFATSISCMDGRIQPVLSDWIRRNYKVDFVDTITAPGVDKRISDEQNLEPLIRMVKISNRAHGSRLIVVSGHHDCAANPTSEENHIAQVKKCVDVIRSWEEKHQLSGGRRDNSATSTAASDNSNNSSIEVVGVWVGDSWTAARVA